MKVLLLFLFAVALCTALPRDETPSEDFLKGFLEGINEKGDIKKLLDCLKDLNPLFLKLKEALAHIKAMKLEEVIKGVTLLVEAVREFMDMLKPCSEGFEQLKRLIHAIARPDIRRIAMRIVQHPGEIIKDITQAIGCFDKADYNCAGVGIGKLLRVLFLQHTVGSSATDFIKGLLEGIGEKGDINKLLECIKDMEGIFKKIIEALQHIKNMKLEEIIKGVTMLIEAIRELMTMLKPCSEGFEQLKKLINAIAHPDIKKIAMRILMHPGEVIKDITQAIACFGKKDYHCAGQAVGKLLHVLFLSRTAANPAVDFVKGLLEGIGEKGDINKLLACIKDLEAIFKKILEALQHIKNMKLEEIIKGVTMLIEAVKQLMDMLKPCSEGFEQLKKLINAIAHPDIKKIAMRILMHPGEVIKEITQAVSCFGKKDYHCAGLAVGKLLHILFLSRAVANPAMDFLKGFLEGIGEKGDINKLLQCLKDMEGIFKKIIEALQHIKNMKLEEIIKGVTMLIEAIREFMTMLKPCAEGFEQLKKLINAIAHPDIKKIAMRILMHPGEVIKDITQAIGCFGKKDYHCAGQGVGKLLHVLFLSRTADNPAIDFVKGLLEGIGEKGDINKLLACIKDLEGIFKKIIEALQHIKNMKLEEIIKGITLLVEAVRELMNMLKPCMEGFEQLKKLINAIAHPDIKKIAMKILMHPGEVIKAVTETIACFSKKDFHCAGKGLGTLLRILFL